MLGIYNYTVILTYVGMLAGFGGMVFAMRGSIFGALVCLLVAGVCDMFDGKIASTKKDRTVAERKFGIQIDSLSDVICFGVLPAVIVTAASCHVAAACVAGVYALCALIRLAWFNVDEEERQAHNEGEREMNCGLPVTTAALLVPPVLGIAHLCEWSLGIIGTVLLGLMAVSFLVPVKFRKPGWVGKIIMLVIGAAVFGALIWVFWGKMM